MILLLKNKTFANFWYKTWIVKNDRNESFSQKHIYIQTLIPARHSYNRNNHEYSTVLQNMQIMQYVVVSSP